VVILFLLCGCQTSATPTQVSKPTLEADRPTSPPPASPTFTPTPKITIEAAEDLCAAATESGARTAFSFEEILPCLDTPDRLVAFMQNNLTYDGDWDNRNFGDNAYSPARDVYTNGMDDCDGLAEFAACVLSSHGYEAYNIGISILGSKGHNVTGYVDRDGQIYAISNGLGVDGPFSSFEELAQLYIDQGFASPPDGVLWLIEPCLEDHVVGEELLDVPHQALR